MTDRAETIDRFVDAWGEMGRIWGIPKTTARIHALLLAEGDPLCLDEVTERLGVSKGGASERLKELREWDVVRRVTLEGDRRDFYEANDDVWSAFLAMVRARKTREFEPAAAAVRREIGGLRSGASKSVKRRLGTMGDILDVLDGLGDRLIQAGPATRTVLSFLSGSRKSK